MNEKLDKSQSVAEEIVRSHLQTKRWALGICGVIAIVMVGAGSWLTQRQMEFQSSLPQNELGINLKTQEFKLRSTYPGSILMIGGTVIMVALIWKRFHLKTQHKDDNHPGYTEADG